MTTIVGASLALLGAGSLVGMSTILHRTTSDATNSVEGVRLAQEVEIQLLLHGKATSATSRGDIEDRVRWRLADARRLVRTEQEARTFAEAESRVAAYLAAARDAAVAPEERATRQDAAVHALQSLVDVNVADAREAHAVATSWDERANYVGTAIAVLLVSMALVLLVWLRSRAFAPVFSLLGVMERFGKGDRDARATETGPTELREMSRRFNDLAEALAAQRQAQVAFLGGVAHDLRNPLSVLQMSVALVPPDAPLPSEQRLRHLLEKIRRQVSRLERMTSDFLDISKIEAGKLELNLGTHDARDLVGEVVDLFAGTTPEPQLLVSMPQESVVLRCDNLRLEQVLTNLISNAIKYSPPGTPIELALEPSAEAVVFRVTDRGVGIPEAEQARVFEPFRRGALSKEAVPGVGLGLFVVSRIVEAHHGEIGVESTPGVGSTFRVSIPRSPRAADDSAARLSCLRARSPAATP